MFKKWQYGHNSCVPLYLNVTFHMINKRTLLVEVWCTSISLNFYLFQNNFASLRGPKWVLFQLKKFSWRPYTGSLHNVNIHLQWRSLRFEPGGKSLAEGGPLVTVGGPLAKTLKKVKK